MNEQSKKWRELAAGYDKVAEYLPLRDALIAAADAYDQLRKEQQHLINEVVTLNKALESEERENRALNAKLQERIAALDDENWGAARDRVRGERK